MGDFTPALAGPRARRTPAALNRINGRAACARAGTGDGAGGTEMEREQGKSSCKQGDKEERNAGWVGPGGKCILIEEKGPFGER